MDSLRKLKTNYVDLWLMHWPCSNTRLKAWAVMEDMLAIGKCRAIGVCNFNVRHMTELIKNCKIVPAVN